MTSPRSYRRSYPHLGIAASAVILIAACSSNPVPGPVVPDPTAAVEAPPPAPPPPQAEAPDKLKAALEALGKSDYTVAHARLMEIVELCGSAPLGQQAVLLIAATELDPRNPDPRGSLAAESTSLLLGELDSMSWAGQFAESFYLIGRRLGAQQLGAEDTEALELGWLFRHGYGRQPPDEPEDGEASTLMDEASLHCEALWAAPSVGDSQGVQGVLPSLPGSSYPAQVTALRRQVRELEEELERIRRIVSQQ